MTPAMPSASAPSLPGRTRSHRSARAARPARRGSTTITRAPRAWAATIPVAWVNQAVLGLYPPNRTHPVGSSSGVARQPPNVACDGAGSTAMRRPSCTSDMRPEWERHRAQSRGMRWVVWCADMVPPLLSETSGCALLPIIPEQQRALHSPPYTFFLLNDDMEL